MEVEIGKEKYLWRDLINMGKYYKIVNVNIKKNIEENVPIA